MKKALWYMAALLLCACSFDYGEASTSSDELPDIVMEEVEYVRVRNGNPLARFAAESAERYEERQVMELRNFTFEQFETRGEELNAAGSAGTATVALDTGNVQLREGIRIDVESEDITIETERLDWQDKERILTAGENQRVDMKRSDGTDFSGWGFSANIRDRTWGFSSGIQGAYFWEDDEEDAEVAEELELTGAVTATELTESDSEAEETESGEFIKEE
ncbi:MAG: LPS export ABC transporter periplasmic protein LptC [Treponema sp.]|jgi:LPS export ABC transporter protein LptC|nr:LPS export ABC transporter periplasmic protein LptC [Treponema sp.]